MNEQINVTASMTVQNGPRLSIDRTLKVPAYHKIDVSLTRAANTLDVEIWPSSTPNQVLFLMITSSIYNEAESSKPYVHYSLKDIDSPPDLTLEHPHVYLGKSAVKLLGNTVKVLTFTYHAPEGSPDVDIQILVGHTV